MQDFAINERCSNHQLLERFRDRSCTIRPHHVSPRHSVSLEIQSISSSPVSLVDQYHDVLKLAILTIFLLLFQSCSTNNFRWVLYIQCLKHAKIPSTWPNWPNKPNAMKVSQRDNPTVKLRFWPIVHLSTFSLSRDGREHEARCFFRPRVDRWRT